MSQRDMITMWNGGSSPHGPSPSSNIPSPTEAVAILRARVADFAYGALTDDLCLLAARIN